jgi:hypothetical protein
MVSGKRFIWGLKRASDMARKPRDNLLPPDDSHKTYRYRKYCLDPETRARLPDPYTGKTALIANLKTTDKRKPSGGRYRGGSTSTI